MFVGGSDADGLGQLDLAIQETGLYHHRSSMGSLVSADPLRGLFE